MEKTRNLISHEKLLEDVSRTFALTIPSLPKPLRNSVTNAYLLCRILDVIEDEPTLALKTKSEFARLFVEIVKGEEDSKRFEVQLIAALSQATNYAEKTLVQNTASIVQVTHALPLYQRQAIERCISIMADGMMDFQRDETGIAGLITFSRFERYCYCVAGVVGEMLTELFCNHSTDISKRREDLLKLSVSFGQGLQMTNILKDIWEDRQRGQCWLPRDVFSDKGIDIASIQAGTSDLRFFAGISELVANAFFHLEKAKDYTLMIPAHEIGIRKFCFCALAMAVLTLKNINSFPAFANGDDVKISRQQVKIVLVTTNLLIRSNLGLKIFFLVIARGLSSVPHLT